MLEHRYVDQARRARAEGGSGRSIVDFGDDSSGAGAVGRDPDGVTGATRNGSGNGSIAGSGSGKSEGADRHHGIAHLDNAAPVVVSARWRRAREQLEFGIVEYSGNPELAERWTDCADHEWFRSTR